MSLKAALKAGLGATDSQSIDGNNNFNSLFVINLFHKWKRYLLFKILYNKK